MALRGSGTVRISMSAGTLYEERVSAQHRAQDIGIECGALSHHDDRLDGLPMGGVVDPEHGSFHHVGVLLQPVFDLEGIDVLASTDDEVAPQREAMMRNAVLKAPKSPEATHLPGRILLLVGGVVAPVPEHGDRAADTECSPPSHRGA